MNKNNQFLKGIKVLDLSEGIAGPFCAKLLADLGADTVKVERPDSGDISRSSGPFPNDDPHIEKSASFFYLNTGKRSMVLDITEPAGQETLKALVQQYDVVIGSEQLASAGIGYAEIRSWNPNAIFTSVTGFGDDGPYAEFESSHLINCAMGGWAQVCGVPEREPIQAGGSTPEMLTGGYAASASLLAVLGRSHHGAGDYIEVSAHQATCCGAQILSLFYEYRDLIPIRYSSVGAAAGGCYMLPTRDGYIGLNALTLDQWHLLCKFMGREDIANNEYYEGISWARPDERLEEVREIFRAALADRSAIEIFHDAQAARVPFGLVPDLAALSEFPPHVERDFYQEIEHPVCGSVKVPGVPFKSTTTSIQVSRPPLLGEHTQEILDELPESKPSHSEDNDELNPLPLKGLRVLDLSMYFAGPSLAQILADAGADVIKIESIQHIDGWRRAGGVAPDGVSTWEASPYFNWINRNKRDVTLNLKDPRGAEVVKKLARDADILLENYTPRVMQSFGLGYDQLKEINERLIMISLSGFGADVAWRDYVAFGMSTEQMSGVCHLTGYEDGEPLFTGTTGGDLLAGVMGTVDVLAALWQREQTGLGQHLDFSQMEACNMYVGDVMTGWFLAQEDPGRRGNYHPGYALQGTYPCKDEGWIAISCKTKAQLEQLCNKVGIDEQDANLEAALSSWTSAQDKIEIMHDLQRAGIPAGAVLNGRDLFHDPHLKARGAYLAQDRPGIGVLHYPAQPYRMNRTEPSPNTRSPLLGEHIEEVLGEEAGLSSDEIVELVIDDVTGTVPLAAL